MGSSSPLRGRRWAGGAVLVLALAGGAWLGSKPLLARFFVHQLAGVAVKDRESWVERTAWLGEAALPALLSCLAREDEQACANAEAALAALAHRWGLEDPRTAALGGQLLAAFPTLSPPGREAVLEWQIALLGSAEGKKGGKALLPTGRDLLQTAALRPEPGVRARALALGDVLADRLDPGTCLSTCRELVRKGLADRQADTRVRAVHLTLHECFRRDTELLRQVLPLLRDPEAVVRRAAVLAVGPAREVIGEEELLPLLHDGDADVRRVCETALRGRGLQDSQLTLARLMSDGRASERLRVVAHLADDPEAVEPGVWLQRLSHDPSPAVRAAAVRAAAAETHADLGDRLREIAGSDPSPTVRQLAAYYLRHR